jgi:hypothetical protein
MTTEKKLTEKQRLINELVDFYSDNKEWKKAFTKARLERGFALDMLRFEVERCKNGS